MDDFSFLHAINADQLSELYTTYLNQPNNVDPTWHAFFKGFDFASSLGTNDKESLEKIQKEFKVFQLIEAYRHRGHLFTKTNPVRERRKYTPTLDIENFQLSQGDLETVFDAGEAIGIGKAPLRDILNHLDSVYCRSIGVEYSHIRMPEKIEWIKRWFEVDTQKINLSDDEKKAAYKSLVHAVLFESFTHIKYTGQKRFSLEGLEVLIPALETLIHKASNMGVADVVLGTTHRGRLNVLANVLRKPVQEIFKEFNDHFEAKGELSNGDVKYHLGWTSHRLFEEGQKILLDLVPNPSHLEAVGPVVQGIARARQEQLCLTECSKALPVVIHGDAAIAGQGVVYETVQMSGLKGYATQGTIHLVLNNQIGFTTNYLDGRTSTYCTDVGKTVMAPILHVNADDVEAVMKALTFAIEYRMTFETDVFIDLLGYRKYGHNEGDEPRFTQPDLYEIISKHSSVKDLYAQQLLDQGVVEEIFLKQVEQEALAVLDEAFESSKQIVVSSDKVTAFMEEEWEKIKKANKKKIMAFVDTTYSKKDVLGLTQKITSLPEDRRFLPKVQKLFTQRREMVVAQNQVDWAMGELLAYATLLDEGFNVRISGQDVERGTFAHRHAVVVDESSQKYVPLNTLNEAARFMIYNSPLSEYGVLGFDYGYAMATPNTLTIWEAQFGDFSNGAQIMIDQYISAAEDKWGIKNGLVMLLPHGYEGQGPEHSSARMERYLQLCASGNMVLANCTTPANFFHLLRKQLKQTIRKPLIVFTPKSLLRHPKVVSSIGDLSEGRFEVVIDDLCEDKSKIKTVVLCTGKFYYDLLQEREALGRNDVALVRLEQLYPLPKRQIKDILSSYPTKHVIWAQEEPKNMGARNYIQLNLGLPMKFVSPKPSSAPAIGSNKLATEQHKQVIKTVFNQIVV